MYIEDGIRYYEDSKINHAIAKVFVEREVRFKMTDFVTYVLDTGKPNNDPPFSFESIDYGPAAMAECPYCHDYIPEEPLDISTLRLMPEINDDPTCDLREKYQCPICGIGHPSYDEARECCEGIEVYQCPSCEHVFSAIEYDDFVNVEEDAHEWWAVTPWLYEKLKAKGAITIEEYHLWGRVDVSENLPIYEDDKILEICKELGILEGQKNSWSKHVKTSA